MTRKILLICGIVSSLLYVAMNVFVPMQYIGVFLLWVVVLATMLLSARDTAAVAGRQGAWAA